MITSSLRFTIAAVSLVSLRLATTLTFNLAALNLALIFCMRARSISSCTSACTEPHESRGGTRDEAHSGSYYDQSHYNVATPIGQPHHQHQLALLVTLSTRVTGGCATSTKVQY